MIHRDFAAVTLTTLPSILGLPIVNNTCALSTPVMDVSDSGIIFPIVSRPRNPYRRWTLRTMGIKPNLWSRPNLPWLFYISFFIVRNFTAKCNRKPTCLSMKFVLAVLMTIPWSKKMEIKALLISSLPPSQSIWLHNLKLIDTFCNLSITVRFG